MKTFVVIGLGRFGSAVATELSSLGHEVLAVDEREDHVQMESIATRKPFDKASAITARR